MDELVHDWAVGDLDDCGCTVRLLQALAPAICAVCHRSWRCPGGDVFEMPTQSPVGAVNDLQGWCGRCNAEISWRTRVIA